jgi:hypothetical protein
MFSFFRSLLVELTSPTPKRKPFRRSTLSDRRQAAPSDPGQPQAAFGRRPRGQPAPPSSGRR